MYVAKRGFLVYILFYTSQFCGGYIFECLDKCECDTEDKIISCHNNFKRNYLNFPIEPLYGFIVLGLVRNNFTSLPDEDLLLKKFPNLKEIDVDLNYYFDCSTLEDFIYLIILSNCDKTAEEIAEVERLMDNTFNKVISDAFCDKHFILCATVELIVVLIFVMFILFALIYGFIMLPKRKKKHMIEKDKQKEKTKAKTKKIFKEKLHRRSNRIILDSTVPVLIKSSDDRRPSESEQSSFVVRDTLFSTDATTTTDCRRSAQSEKEQTSNVESTRSTVSPPSDDSVEEEHSTQNSKSIEEVLEIYSAAAENSSAFSEIFSPADDQQHSLKSDQNVSSRCLAKQQEKSSKKKSSVSVIDKNISRELDTKLFAGISDRSTAPDSLERK